MRLDGDDYVLDIMRVNEIIRPERITPVRKAPEFVRGVIELRGTIVPIVDMRIKFKLGEPVYNQFTVVIILNVAGRVVGMVVDSVSDVIQLEAEQVRPAPQTVRPGSEPDEAASTARQRPAVVCLPGN